VPVCARLRIRFTFVVVALVVTLAGAVIVPATSASAQPAPATRTLESFIIDLVVPDLDKFWTMTARDNGLSYATPKVRLFQAGDLVMWPCGNDIVGGHMYCPKNSTIYLDLSARSDASFARLWRQDRDFAVVAIVAHEWGHHVQRHLGLMQGSRSVRLVELQADCMAGLYTRYAELTGKLDPGDLEEGVAIALESGDPSHGTGRERSQSFMVGYRQYTGAACGLRG
jgi:predicted metalloprotease